MKRETDMKILTMLALALSLIACSSENSGKRQEREPTVGKEIADDYNRQMDKARAVEEQVMQQKQRIDEALEEPES